MCRCRFWNKFDFKRAEDISGICFDHEEKIPIKEEIKQEIKSEPLGEDVDEVHEESVENYDKSRDDKRPSSPPKLNRFDSDPPMPTLSTGNLWISRKNFLFSILKKSISVSA